MASARTPLRSTACAITGADVINHGVDLRDFAATDDVFASAGPIDAVIHFAAFKSVPESVREPLLYLRTTSIARQRPPRRAEAQRPARRVLLFLLGLRQHRETPGHRGHRAPGARIPYARTKQMGEQMLQDIAKVSRTTFISLRYFNPVGAHESGLLGEMPFGGPENLVPAITQTGIGRRGQLVSTAATTRPATGPASDYVHVSDIARAHGRRPALMDGRNEHGHEIFNLGSGIGVTVLEPTRRSSCCTAWRSTAGSALAGPATSGHLRREHQGAGAFQDGIPRAT
jgi:UDP-glucose 4-epimerase